MTSPCCGCRRRWSCPPASCRSARRRPGPGTTGPGSRSPSLYQDSGRATCSGDSGGPLTAQAGWQVLHLVPALIHLISLLQAGAGGRDVLRRRLRCQGPTLKSSPTPGSVQSVLMCIYLWSGVQVSGFLPWIRAVMGSTSGLDYLQYKEVPWKQRCSSIVIYFFDCAR
jgi:hypothetical protein